MAGLFLLYLRRNRNKRKEAKEKEWKEEKLGVTRGQGFRKFLLQLRVTKRRGRGGDGGGEGVSK